MQRDHIGCETLELLHAAGQGLDRDVARGADLLDLQAQVGERLGAAEQRQAGGALGGGQRVLLRRAVVYLRARPYATSAFNAVVADLASEAARRALPGAA